MAAFSQLRELRFQPACPSVHVGAALQLELRLCSLMPVAVRLEQLAVSVHFSLEAPGSHRGPATLSTPQKRNPGVGLGGASSGVSPDGTVVFPAVSPAGGGLSGVGPGSAGALSSGTSSALELYEIQDRSPSDNTLNTTGVVCKNVHLLLRRRDSATSLDTPSAAGGGGGGSGSGISVASAVTAAVAMEDGTQMLKTHDVTLLPGNNSIPFSAPVRAFYRYT